MKISETIPIETLMNRKNFLKKSFGFTAFISGSGLFGTSLLKTGNISNNPSKWPSNTEVCHFGKKAFRDPKTGRKLWMMTDGHCNSFVPYQYNQAFTKDEKYFVFNSDRTGLNQMYRMEVETGEAAQLTYFSDYRPRPIVHSDGEEAYFRAAGAKVWAIDVKSGRTRQVIDASNLTEENRLHGLNISGDEELLLITYYRKDSDDMALALANTDGSTKPEEVFVFEYHPIRGEVNRVGHPQFCPTDNNLISCIKLPDHQGGWPVERKSIDLPDELRARTWLIDLETQQSKPLIVTPAGHRATHEYWAPNGSKMFYHQKSVPGFVPTSIKSVNLDRTEIETYIESDTIKLGHSAVNHDETKIVSDSQEPYLNELLLIDIEMGDFEILCWPNTSGDGQMNHTHPNFSRYGNMIIYTSDATGFAQIYLIDLSEKS